jgi:hypothetical protein
MAISFRGTNGDAAAHAGVRSGACSTGHAAPIFRDMPGAEGLSRVRLPSIIRGAAGPRPAVEKADGGDHDAAGVGA